jgi:ankyrin repeat protein
MIARHGSEFIKGGATRRLLLLGAAFTAGLLAATGARADVAADRRLLEAAVRGDRAAVAAALAAGAAIDARDARRQTALLIAVAGNHISVALDLIAGGADINAVADNRDTPWLLAGAEGRTALIRPMLATGRVDFGRRNRYGGNALIPAAHHGHPDTVRALLENSKIDVDHVNDLGWTALLEAVILGDGGPAHVEIVRLLIAHKADVNLADRGGVSPLAHAKRRGFAAIARMLEEAGGK